VQIVAVTELVVVGERDARLVRRGKPIRALPGTKCRGRVDEVVVAVDLRVGGRYSYLWRGHGTEMGMGGVYREIIVPERIVSTEKFDEPWYPGEAIGTVVLTEQAGTTTLTQTLQYESRAARDGVLKSPMESGIAMSYDRLEKLMASEPVGANQ